MGVPPVNDSWQTIHTGSPMKFQIKERVLGRGLRDSRMVRWGHESYHPKYPGIAPA